ncbi:MAG: ATPase, T2SS/T4P/T4SS family [Micrococcales bacterium]
MALPNLTDLLINGTEVYARCGATLEQQPSFIKSNLETTELAKRLIGLGGGHLDFANPMVDTVLYEDSLPLPKGVLSIRVHAVIDAFVATKTLISIRIQRSEIHTFSFGQFESELLTLASGQGSFVISGATGSGKTSLLRKLLSATPQLRTVLLEDTQELRGLKGHFLELSSRAANTEGYGEISLQNVLTHTLRMRPDRIVLGEVRGPEIFTLLQALNLGVKQVACTIHANSAFQVRDRMLALWLQATQSVNGFDQLLAQNQITVVHLKDFEVTEVQVL